MPRVISRDCDHATVTFSGVCGTDGSLFEGSMKEGPWSYRIGSLVIVSPIYSVVLLTVGTLAGRHRFFARMSYKIMGRFVPQFAMSHLSTGFTSLFPTAARCGTWGR